MKFRPGFSIVIAIAAITVMGSGCFSRSEKSKRSRASTQGASQSSSAIGNLDFANCSEIGGWAYDPDQAAAPISIHLYDGGAGAVMLGAVSTAGLRAEGSDLWKPVGSHRFALPTPESLKDGKPHAVYAYGFDSAGGPPVQLGPPRTFRCPDDGSVARVSGDAQISAPVLGSPLVISTSNRMAGSVVSLRWKGKEFINATDHGRELQTAFSVDALGECYNPTEAGGSYDRTESSSILRSISATGNVLTSETDMAFWLQPGENYGRLCNPNLPGSPSVAQNRTRTAGYLLNKTIMIGVPGVAENAIRYDSVITIPNNHFTAAVEALTGYMPAEFSNFYSYNVGKRELKALDAEMPDSKSYDPLIFATPNGEHAMGVFTKMGGIFYGYGKFGTNPLNPSHTSKWNVVLTLSNVRAGQTFPFTTYVVVGSIEQVKDGIQKLQSTFSEITVSFQTSNNDGTATSQSISWNINGATRATIDQGVGAVEIPSGSLNVSVSSPTVYTLTASNAGGSVSESVTVYPLRPPFRVGDRVRLNRQIVVENAPGLRDYSFPQIPSGSVGTIVDTIANYFRVDFDNRSSSLVLGNSLDKLTGDTPASAPPAPKPPAPEPAPVPAPDPAPAPAPAPDPAPAPAPPSAPLIDLSTLPKPSGEGESALRPYFDEKLYLETYPDVAAVVKPGIFASGLQHYVLYGASEGRIPNNWFDEATYLATYPDVAEAVKAKSLISGFEHYIRAGAREGRTFIPGFNERAYLTRYPDVCDVVRGIPHYWLSGLQHYMLAGKSEGRIPN